MKLIDKLRDWWEDTPSQRFHEGQSITPSTRPSWQKYSQNSADHLGKGNGPAFGEIVKVVKYVRVDRIVRNGKRCEKCWFISITGYSDNYSEIDFSPVIETYELNELLQEIKQPQAT